MRRRRRGPRQGGRVGGRERDAATARRRGSQVRRAGGSPEGGGGEGRDRASATTLADPNFFAAACVLQNPSSADTIAKADTYTQVSSPIVTSGAVQDVEAGFPKVNDTTTENTGKDVDAVTYKFTWTTSQIDTSAGNPITGGCIIDSADAAGDSVTAGSKILTHWNFVSPSSFHKTNTDTLTLYVNHTMSGQA